MTLGGLVTLALFVHDILSFVKDLKQTRLHDLAQGIWQGLEQSTFEPTKGSSLTYRSTYFKDGTVQDSLYEAEKLREKGLWLDQNGMQWTHLNWRAIVPLYRMGFSRDMIKQLVSYGDNHISAEKYADLIKNRTQAAQAEAVHRKHSKFLKTGATAQDYATYYENIENTYYTSDGAKQRLASIKQKPPMSVDAIIDYYKIVSDPESAKKSFYPEQTYAKVSRALENGSFVPQFDGSEDLDIQKGFKYAFDFYLAQVRKSHPGYRQELIMGTWGHELFIKG